MSPVVQLILDEPPGSGAWNMAVDQALLEESLQSDATFVRLYRWSEATLSLGYFQNESDRLSDPHLALLPWVRRLTGGGAILHHHEQTYSCSLPPSHPHARQPYALYERIHAAIRATLRELGAELASRGSDGSRPEPFLCFQRQAGPDLTICGQKVLGSAQRRRRGGVLQHGSLLLRASEFAPQLPGLLDIAPKTAWDDEVAARLGTTVAASLGQVSDPTVLPDSVRQRALTITNMR